MLFVQRKYANKQSIHIGGPQGLAHISGQHDIEINLIHTLVLLINIVMNTNFKLYIIKCCWLKGQLCIPSKHNNRKRTNNDVQSSWPDLIISIDAHMHLLIDTRGDIDIITLGTSFNSSRYFSPVSSIILVLCLPS